MRRLFRICVFLVAALCLVSMAEKNETLPSLIEQVRFCEIDQFAVLGRETRQLDFTSKKTIFTQKCTVPENGVLETAFGIDSRMKAFFVGDAVFLIELEEAEASSVVLYNETVSLNAGRRAVSVWHPVAIDLTSCAGREVVLKFTKNARGKWKAGAALAPVDLMYWAKPHVRSRKLAGHLNVILVSIDTVRADHLSLMGYPRATSPNIERLAAQGCFFKTTVSQAPWTVPSHFSILTSTYPKVHRADVPMLELSTDKPRWNRSLPTLAQLLQNQGYLTAAFTGSGCMSSRFGFSSGFDTYVEIRYPETRKRNTDCEVIFGNAIEWLREHADRTFFLFVHTYEPHSPYVDEYFAKSERITKFDKTRWRKALYDGDIRKADYFLGSLLDEVDALGLADNTLVIVTSDHGEDLDGVRNPPDAEYKTGHGFNLYDEMLLVPLVMRGPGIQPHEKGITPQVRLIDILPTVLDYLDIPEPDTIQGKSLRGMIEGRDRLDRPAVCEATCTGCPREGLRVDGFKYVHRLEDRQIGGVWVNRSPEFEVYDLDEDPGELDNIAQENSARTAAFQRQLDELANTAPKRILSDPKDNDHSEFNLQDNPELAEQLEALGYLE